MRVLHVHEALEIVGGSEVYISLLCKYLPLYHIETDWVSINFSDSQYNVRDKRGVIDFSCSKLDFRGSLRLFLIKYGYNLIHIHGVSDPFVVDVCLDMLPVVRSLHEPRVFCPGSQKFFLKSEEVCKIPFGYHCFAHAYTEKCCNRHPRRLLKAYNNTKFEVKNASPRYGAIIAMSQYMKNEAVLAGIESSNIYVNPYFVEETDIVENQSQERRTILFLGRLHETKGVHYLLDAFALLSKSTHFRIELQIIGSGSFETFLKSKSERLGIGSMVQFMGWQAREEIQRALSNSDVVAVPSIYPEAFGIVGIEAMMAAKPVVGFDVGGISDWLHHDQTGFLIPVKDSVAFAHGLERLLTDAELYTRFSINSRKIAIDHFTPSVHLNKLVAVYQSLLSSI
ncbi:MAG TPA: glycosyltransferase family 4 protein [Flavitalea sp.]|nr:glycosyltransferase family 4 protein [Flavitalea sp.]